MLSSIAVSIFEENNLHQVGYSGFPHIDHMMHLIPLNWVSQHVKRQGCSSVLLSKAFWTKSSKTTKIISSTTNTDKYYSGVSFF